MRLGIGRVKGEMIGYKNSAMVTLDIELRTREKGIVLSIVGDVWNRQKTDIIMGGQCDEELRRWLNEGKFKTLFIPEAKLRKIFDIWERWHLNNMIAGCSHQAQRLRDNPTLPREYEKLLGIKEFKSCSECGYQYGDRWNFEKLPDEVLEFVRKLIGWDE